jgi:hypothetical protein
MWHCGETPRAVAGEVHVLAVETIRRPLASVIATPIEACEQNVSVTRAGRKSPLP